MQLKKVMPFVLLLAVGLVWWIDTVDKEVNRFEIIQEEETPKALPSIISDGETPDSWEIDQFKAFFIEYRLQRDRVRAGEIEMLNDLLSSKNVSKEGKSEAENQMLKLVETTEKELLVENLLKAHGFQDAVLFYREGMAKVIVKADEKIGERDFMLIVEMVSGVTGVPVENVTVVEHQGHY